MKPKQKAEKIIRRRFKYLSIRKVVIYRNPNECSSQFTIPVNPDHIHEVWGIRKRRLRKTKGDNPVRIGKIYLYSIPIVTGLSIAGWLDMFTNYIYGLLLRIGIYSMFINISIAIIYWMMNNYAIKSTYNVNSDVASC